MHKQCSRCKESKPFESFPRDRSKADGHHTICKQCKKVTGQIRYRANATTISADRKRRRQDPITGPLICEQDRNAFQRNKAQKLQQRKERAQKDSAYYLRNKYSKLMTQLLTRQTKISKYYAYVGCDITNWRAWLESKFTEGMTWDNYGRDGWSIDHIIPLSSFDLSIEAERYSALHYTNTQPLWLIDNVRKSNKQGRMSDGILLHM